MTPAVEKAADAVRAGTLHPFTGPITDNKGPAKVATGATIPDDALLKMDCYVAGVQA